MTMNVINASVLTAVREAIAIKRKQTDEIDNADVNWHDEAKSLMHGIGASANVDIKKYLVTEHMYDVSTIELAFQALGLLESSSPTMIEDVIDPSKSLTPYTGGEAPNPAVVKHIVDHLNLTPKESAAGTPEVPAKPTCVVDAGMMPAINSLLAAASKGKVNDIAAILHERDQLADTLGTTKSELAAALMKARAPHVPSTGKVTVAAGELTYEVVEVPAKSVFTSANGKSTKSTKGLAFNIPTLVWKDASGNVVTHPEVPDVDENYDFDAVKLLQVLTGLTLGMNQWLFGHTGTGKTTFIEQVAARIGWPCLRINLDANLERADIVGHVALTEKGGTTITKFEEGILPHAMQRPGFLIMDEIDAGRPDILFCVQKALESKGLTLTEDNYRLVTPHPLFRFAATANTRGQGDEYGMYQGTRTMNASLIDRFSSFIEFGYMKPDRESALLIKLVPALAKDVADKMSQFAAEVRSAFSKGEVYNTVSPRGLSKLAECYATFTGLGTSDDQAFQLAMDMTILNKVTNDTRQKFVELAARTFGFKVK